MKNKKLVIVTGASGLIGTALSKVLIKNGYEVEHLVRTKTSKSGVKNHCWNFKTEKIDDSFFESICQREFAIIHLAGEGIADKKWTTNRKNAIVKSRTAGLDLLYKNFKFANQFPKMLISAGGIGYYGAITSEKNFNENDEPGCDFLARCCIEWENSVKQFDNNCITTILRTPFVLDRNEGGLPKMAGFAQFGFSPIFGTGKQWIPFVHIQDLCNAYHYVLKNELSGIFNVTSPENKTQKQFMKTLAKQFCFPFVLPKINEKILHFFLGEMVVMVTQGSRINSEKLINKGFKYNFASLEKAFKNIYE